MFAWLSSLLFASESRDWLETTGFEVDEGWIECHAVGTIIDWMATNPSMFEGALPPGTLSRLNTPVGRSGLGVVEDGWIRLAMGQHGVRFSYAFDGGVPEATTVVGMLGGGPVDDGDWDDGVVAFGPENEVLKGDGVLHIRGFRTESGARPASQGIHPALARLRPWVPEPRNACTTVMARALFVLGDLELTDPLALTFPFARDEPVLARWPARGPGESGGLPLPSVMSATRERPVMVVASAHDSWTNGIQKAMFAGATGERWPQGLRSLVRLSAKTKSAVILARFADGGTAGEVFVDGGDRREVLRRLLTDLEALGLASKRRGRWVVEVSNKAGGATPIWVTERGTLVTASTPERGKEISEHVGSPWLEGETLAMAPRHPLLFHVQEARFGSTVFPLSGGMRLIEGVVEGALLDRDGAWRKNMLEGAAKAMD